MIQERVQVRYNTIECSGYYRMGLTCHSDYRRAKPGQFVMLRVVDGMNPLLRRPFSIHRLIRSSAGAVEGLEILYKVVGTGTERLADCRRGDGLSLLGPLGRPFSLPERPAQVFIAAGGIGVAPMYFLTETLQKKGFDISSCVVFIGGRSKDDLLCMNDFFTIGVKTVNITTDDGTAGEQDVVTGPIERAVKEGRPDVIYACGPLPMLRATARMARRYDIPCQISIETMMGCGIGACLGCAVSAAGGGDKYLHACVDGPVFNAADIDL
jgi:dihydroorotate dehydrogenase electron transfer subunit